MMKPNVIFLGAGASWDSGLPLGDNAAKFIIKSAFQKANLLPVYQKLNNHNETWPRFEVVMSILSNYIHESVVDILKTFNNNGISSTHRFLSSSLQPAIWLTTNFDNQIEISLDELKLKYKVISSRNDFNKIHSYSFKEHLIIKLHGDSNSFNIDDDIGAKIEQILVNFPYNLSKQLTQITENKELLIIGYAARDPDLKLLLSELIKKSSRVAWIGLGDMIESEKEMISIRDDVINLRDGSPNALFSIFPDASNHKAQKSDGWFTKVQERINSYDDGDVLNFLADICIERNDKFSKYGISTIHDNLSSNEFNLFKILEREIKLTLRNPDIYNEKIIDEFSRKLSSISINSKTASIKTKATISLSQLLWNTNDAIKALDLLTQFSNQNDLLHTDVESYLDVEISKGLFSVYIGGSILKSGISILENARKVAQKYKFQIKYADATMRYAIGIMRSNMPKESLKLLESIEHIYNEIGNPRSILVWKINYAESLRRNNNSSEAIKVLKEIINYSTLLNDIEVLLNAQGNLALNYCNIGELVEADRIYNQTIKTIQDIPIHKELLCNTFYNKAWLRLLISDWENSAILFEETAHMFEKIYPCFERRGGSLALAAWCHWSLGNFEKSNLIFNEIKNKLVPSGEKQVDYNFIKYVLENQNNIINSDISFVKSFERDFEKLHEQRWYLYSWMLFKPIKDKEAIFNYACKCIVKGKIQSGYIFLEHILKRDNVSTSYYYKKKIKQQCDGKTLENVKKILVETKRL